MSFSSIPISTNSFPIPNLLTERSEIMWSSTSGRQLDWWTNHSQRFDLRISALVEEEISSGDKDAAKRRRQLVAEIPSLAVSDLAIQVAEQLLAKGAIPSGSENDALHIGIAAAQGADYLLTWNFRHINNAEMKSAIEKVVESFGCVCPEICSPEELAGESND